MDGMQLIHGRKIIKRKLGISLMYTYVFINKYTIPLIYPQRINIINDFMLSPGGNVCYLTSMKKLMWHANALFGYEKKIRRK